MKIKKVFVLFILIFWMILIFSFSNQNVTTSLSFSDRVASSMIDTVIKITGKEVSKEQKAKLVKETRVMIRKTAHFTEYFILGILVYYIFNIYSVSKPVIYAILFCFLYACSDELHQLFSDGRTAKVLDVLIDTSGSLLSIGFLHFIKKRKIEINKDKKPSQKIG